MPPSTGDEDGVSRVLGEFDHVVSQLSEPRDKIHKIIKNIELEGLLKKSFFQGNRIEA
jgi:hypothetical protein